MKVSTNSVGPDASTVSANGAHEVLCAGASAAAYGIGVATALGGEVSEPRVTASPATATATNRPTTIGSPLRRTMSTWNSRSNIATLETRDAQTHGVSDGA